MKMEISVHRKSIVHDISSRATEHSCLICTVQLLLRNMDTMLTISFIVYFTECVILMLNIFSILLVLILTANILWISVMLLSYSVVKENTALKVFVVSILVT